MSHLWGVDPNGNVRAITLNKSFDMHRHAPEDISLEFPKCVRACMRACVCVRVCVCACDTGGESRLGAIGAARFISRVSCSAPQSRFDSVPAMQPHFSQRDRGLPQYQQLPLLRFHSLSVGDERKLFFSCITASSVRPRLVSSSPPPSPQHVHKITTGNGRREQRSTLQCDQCDAHHIPKHPPLLTAAASYCLLLLVLAEHSAHGPHAACRRHARAEPQVELSPRRLCAAAAAAAAASDDARPATGAVATLCRPLGRRRCWCVAVRACMRVCVRACVSE